MPFSKVGYTITNYGYKRPGEGRFVVVAPHAAGDDLKSGFIARALARRLRAACVVNDKYFKPTNSRAKDAPEFVEDFNRLSRGRKSNRYLWKRKKPAMKEFFDDVRQFCREVKKMTPGKKAVVIYIHGMPDNGVDIDLGVGLHAKKNKARFLGSKKNDYDCTGVLTVRFKQLKELRRLIIGGLPAGIVLGIGQRHRAWSRLTAVQFHKHAPRNNFAMQIEFSRRLRFDKINRKCIIKLLANGFKNVFPQI